MRLYSALLLLSLATPAWAEHTEPDHAQEAVEQMRRQRSDERIMDLETEQFLQQQRDYFERRDRAAGWDTHYPRWGYPDSRPLRR